MPNKLDGQALFNMYRKTMIVFKVEQISDESHSYEVKIKPRILDFLSINSAVFIHLAGTSTMADIKLNCLYMPHNRRIHRKFKTVACCFICHILQLFN
jgi:hypothetical protein